MSETQKNEPFLFNNDFGGDTASKASRARAQEQHLALLKREYNKGYEAGLSTNNEQQMTQIKEELSRLNEHLSDHLIGAQTALDHYRRTAGQLGKHAAIKLAHRLIADDPKVELEQFFKQVLDLLPKAETITLALSGEMLNVINQADTDLAGLSNLILVADDDLSLSDAKFTWETGGISRDLQTYTQVIDDAVERFVSAPPPEDTKPHEEPNAP